MIQFPDHVCKSLLMKINDIEIVDKDIAKAKSHISDLNRKRSNLVGEIKGMLQAEEFENERRKDGS